MPEAVSFGNDFAPREIDPTPESVSSLGSVFKYNEAKCQPMY